MDEQPKGYDLEYLKKKWHALLDGPKKPIEECIILEPQSRALPFVVHCKKLYYDVYVGRPSDFGNPFEIDKDGTREEVIEKYRKWFFSQPKLMTKTKKELKGKILGCWCAPLACHADILSEYANG